MQTQNGKPELIVPLQNQHHPVAPVDAHGLEVIGSPGRLPLEVLESKATLGLILADVEHSQTVWLFCAQRIDHVIGKVKLLLVPEADLEQLALLIFHRGNEALIDPVLGIIGLGCNPGCGSNGCCLLPFTGCRIAQNDGIESAILTFNGNHTVRNGGIIVNTVTGVENLGLTADLDAHMTADDNVTFLPLMGSQINVRILCTAAVRQLHIKRQRNAVAEVRSQVVAHHMVCLFDPLAFSPTGQCIGPQLGTVTFQQVAHVNTEAQSTAVKERNTQLPGTGFTLAIFFFGNAGALCHFSNGNAGDLPQFPDTGSGFPELIFQRSYILLAHKMPPVRDEKSPSQR